MLKPPFAKLATGVIGGVPSPFGAGKPIIFAISREDLCKNSGFLLKF